MAETKNHDIVFWNDFISFFSKIKQASQHPAKSKNFNAQEFFKSYNCPLTQFAYVIDFTNGGQLEYHKGIDKCLGYDIDEIDMKLVFEIVHPDDLQVAMKMMKISFEYASEFKNLKPFEDVFFMDYRVRKKNGEYIRVMRQSSPFINDDDGKISTIISICTDVTQMKKSNEISFGIIGPHADEFNEKYKINDVQHDLSKRELEVLSLLIEGKTSQEIANKIFVTEESVRTYRKRILSKTGCKNTAELIYFSIKKGIIQLN